MSAASRLPAELWQQILSFAALEDKPTSFVHLWVSGRQVSKTWRALITQTYLDTFIRNPSRCFIAFDCGYGCFEVMDNPNRILAKQIMPMQMVFDRLDLDDKRRCFFKESADTCGKLPQGWSRDQREQYRDSKYGNWAEQLEAYMNPDWNALWGWSSDEDDPSGGGNGPDRDEEKTADSDVDDSIDKGESETVPMNFERPSHVVYIYGGANDTELPGLKVDLEKVEIGFDWESMLTALIKERAEVNRRHGRQTGKITDEMKTKHPVPLTSARHIVAVSYAAYENIQASDSKTVRRVRRERIVKAVNARGPKEFRDGMWVFDIGSFDHGHERRQIRNIDNVEYIGGWEDEDEDEENEEGEDGGEDENEVDGGNRRQRRPWRIRRR